MISRRPRNLIRSGAYAMLWAGPASEAGYPDLAADGQGQESTCRSVTAGMLTVAAIVDIEW